jgi:hypothetical protein
VIPTNGPTPLLLQTLAVSTNQQGFFHLHKEWLLPGQAGGLTRAFPSPGPWGWQQRPKGPEVQWDTWRQARYKLTGGMQASGSQPQVQGGWGGSFLLGQGHPLDIGPGISVDILGPTGC